MSKKKQLVIQEVITTEEKWAEYMSRDGLKVVDAYTEWCGECRALTSFIKGLKTDIGDPILFFSKACTDNIEALKPYCGNSEPITLFFGKNVLIDVIRGANSPAIEKAVRSYLEAEHDCIENGTERTEFIDVALIEAVEEEPEDEQVAEATPVKTYTFAMIKASAVADGTADAIFADIAEAGFKVESGALDDVELDADSAKAMFAHLEGQENVDQLLESLVGTVKKFVLSNATEDAVTTWLSLISPTEAAGDENDAEDEAKVEEPKPEEEKQDGDEAQVEETTTAEIVDAPLAKYSDVLFGSATAEDAETEIKLAFPDWAAEHLVTKTEESPTTDAPDTDASETPTTETPTTETTESTATTEATDVATPEATIATEVEGGSNTEENKADVEPAADDSAGADKPQATETEEPKATEESTKSPEVETPKEEPVATA
eukprot:m.263507 g.263507  ORF g.263507 m.263507 type:complete len:434 (-) comp50642_c0_seq1:116-1417(-)